MMNMSVKEMKIVLISTVFALIFSRADSILFILRRVGTAKYRHILSEINNLAHLLVFQKFLTDSISGNR